MRKISRRLRRPQVEALEWEAYIRGFSDALFDVVGILYDGTSILGVPRVPMDADGFGVAHKELTRGIETGGLSESRVTFTTMRKDIVAGVYDAPFVQVAAEAETFAREWDESMLAKLDTTLEAAGQTVSMGRDVPFPRKVLEMLRTALPTRVNGELVFDEVVLIQRSEKGELKRILFKDLLGQLRKDPAFEGEYQRILVEHDNAQRPGIRRF